MTTRVTNQATPVANAVAAFGDMMMSTVTRPAVDHAPLWSPSFEHDSCGVGLVVDIAGKPSHEIVKRALAGLVNLTHRGGVGADARTGDGSGVLTQIPYRLFRDDLVAAGHGDVRPGGLGVAMVFLPTDPTSAAGARRAFEDGVRHRGLLPIAWREVPVD